MKIILIICVVSILTALVCLSIFTYRLFIPYQQMMTDIHFMEVDNKKLSERLDEIKEAVLQLSENSTEEEISTILKELLIIRDISEKLKSEVEELVIDKSNHPITISDEQKPIVELEFDSSSEKRKWGEWRNNESKKWLGK